MLTKGSTSSNEIIIGRQPVLEAIKSGTSIEKIFFLYGVQGNAIDRVRKLAKQHGIPVSEMDKQRFQELVGDATAQGVAAIAATQQYIEIEDIIKASQSKNESPFILILDEIEDPHNLGALIRTAECAGVHGVIIPKHHTATVNQTVAKSSAGASLHLPIAKVTNIAQALDVLKSEGLWIVGTDMSGDKMYYEANLEGPLAIVIGNEGKGIRRLVREKCDYLVTIPMYGKIESLNASVAGGLVLFEAARARHGKQNPVVRSQ
ncbi:MAG: 23S rRNA (guanosine(2251)-2'-O)-methyltransferase RlmB [Ignavibacteriales bacterium]|nr:23S rRNA (guanosine(2251)-2'-O)-methyltransferase RlmB [Ignavibacteriales bacterium]